jgi:hypothetical protein
VIVLVIIVTLHFVLNKKPNVNVLFQLPLLLKGSLHGRFLLKENYIFGHRIYVVGFSPCQNFFQNFQVTGLLHSSNVIAGFDGELS